MISCGNTPISHRAPARASGSDSANVPDRAGQQLGNYLLIRLLGRGGFADVYLGQHIHLGTPAAIKVLHGQLTSEDLESFRQEARIVARLRHAHIISVLDFDVQQGGTSLLVMDLAPGGTLRQRHPRGAILSPATFLPYLRQVADALQYAHGQRVIHRDVKPENLFLGRNGEVLLGDFGIAVATASARSRALPCAQAGTAAYMAPEQLVGTPCKASDQYALGIVVYEWLSGSCPFLGTLIEISAQHLHAPPPPLCGRCPHVSPEMEAVILRALAKEPRARYPSVCAFALAFASAVQASAPTVYPGQPTVPAAPGGEWTAPSAPARHGPGEAGPNNDLLPPGGRGRSYGRRPGRPLALLLALVGCAVACVGGISLLVAALSYGSALVQAANPQLAVTHYYQALERQDYTAAYAVLDGVNGKQVTEQEFASFALARDVHNGVVRSFSLSLDPLDKGMVIVTVARSGPPYTVYLRLKQEGSGWKIVQGLTV